MKKIFALSFLVIFITTFSLNNVFAGVGYQGDTATQFTGENYETLKNKCGENEISKEMFENYKSILSKKTTVIVDGKPIPGDASYGGYSNINNGKTKIPDSFGVYQWMSRMISEDGSNNYVYAYLMDMENVINLFGKERFQQYLSQHFNKERIDKLPIQSGVKDGCGFTFIAGNQPYVYKQSILTDYTSKNPLAAYDKIYVSALNNGIYDHINYFNLSAVDSVDVGYLDINNPKTNITMYINYNNNQITFGGAISSKLSSLTISSKDGTSLVKIYNYSDAKKVQTLSNEDFKKLVDEPVIVKINGDTQIAGDLINDKTILSKYSKIEKSNNEGIENQNTTQDDMLNDLLREVPIIAGSTPLVDEKQEALVQKVVSKIVSKGQKTKTTVLKQLENMKNKISQNKKDIFDRLVYLLSTK